MGRDSPDLVIAKRLRKSSLIIPGDGLIERRVDSSALTVLYEVLCWEPGS